MGVSLINPVSNGFVSIISTCDIKVNEELSVVIRYVTITYRLR